MASLGSLQSQIRALREKIPLKSDPKQWCLQLVGDEEIPAAIRARIGPDDRVVIHQLMVDFLDEGLCIGWVLPLNGSGPAEILYREDTDKSAHLLPDLAQPALSGDSRGH